MIINENKLELEIKNKKIGQLELDLEDHKKHLLIGNSFTKNPGSFEKEENLETIG